MVVLKWRLISLIMNTALVENIESSQLDILIKWHRFSAVPSPPSEKAQENLAILSTHGKKKNQARTNKKNQARTKKKRKIFLQKPKLS